MFSLNTLKSINEHASIVREDGQRRTRGLKPLNATARAVRNSQAAPRFSSGKRKVTVQGRIVEV